MASKNAKSSASKSAGKLHKTRIDLGESDRLKIVGVLNEQLADMSDLYSQIKHAHWNVKGPQFIALHELFDQLATSVLAFVDVIAERATTLGGVANGTARMVAAESRVPEFDAPSQDGTDFVAALAERFANVCASTRSAIDITDSLGDADTSDLFTEVSRELDKNLWFLEAHLQK